MLELPFEIEPDELGIFDGRDLAAQLIETAYQLLVPYVNACPRCADALFSVIANGAIERQQDEARRTCEELAGFLLTDRGRRDTPAFHAAELAHLSVERARTAQLLGNGSDHGEA